MSQHTHTHQPPGTSRRGRGRPERGDLSRLKLFQPITLGKKWKRKQPLSSQQTAEGPRNHPTGPRTSTNHRYLLRHAAFHRNIPVSPLLTVSFFSSAAARGALQLRALSQHVRRHDPEGRPGRVGGPHCGNKRCREGNTAENSDDSR